MKNIAWFLLALALLTACASEKGGSPQSAPSASAPPGIATPTSNVSVAPADPAWSTTQASDGYRDAISSVTGELASLSKMSPKTNLKQTQAALRAYSQASTASVEQLLQGSWGPDVAPTVNTLIAALLDQQKYFDALAGSTSADVIRAQADKTAQILLVTRYWSAELEKKLGVSEGLLDPNSPGAS